MEMVFLYIKITRYGGGMGEGEEFIEYACLV